MKKYICSNCGSLCDNSYVKQEGCFPYIAKIIFNIVFIIMLFGPFFWVSIIGWLIWLIIACSTHKDTENCCPHCKAENTLMATNSPKGQELVRKYFPDDLQTEDDYNDLEEITDEEEAENRRKIGCIALSVIGLISLLVGLTSIIGESQDDNKENLKTEQITNQKRLQQEASTETIQPKKKTEIECQNEYNTTMMNILIESSINALEQIDDYYKECGEYKSIRNKYSYLSALYYGVGIEYKEKSDLANAALYLEKSLEYNLKSPDKLNIEFNYSMLAETYFSNWEMEKAKKYYKLACKPEKLYCLEGIADSLYNLKQYDEADVYYKKALSEAIRLENQYYPNDEELHNKINKFQSILDGTFEQ